MFSKWTRFNRLGHLWHWILEDHPPIPGTLMKNGLPERIVLWVDGVGGFLICLSNKVTLGQAVPGTTVDIPILADLSGKHATIHRDGENYLVEPHGTVFLHGDRILEPTLLKDGAELTLGRDVQIQFHTPHPLSTTARLNFTSHYHTKPRCDAILLVSQSIVLGPSQQNHILCRQWPDDIVIFQRQNKLFCRSKQPVKLDGKPLPSTTPVQCGQRISMEGCVISLEEVKGGI